MKILVGTPIHHGGAYALEHFLRNQKEIQNNNPNCELILSTNEKDYIVELESIIRTWQLRSKIIAHTVLKPEYAKGRMWNIASARESIRQYFLSHHEFDSLLFLDSDMTFDPQVIDIMEKQLSGYDAVFCGYRFRNDKIGLLGAGCFLLSRRALGKIRFRCYEFKNGESFYEDSIAEMDLFRQGCRMHKGFFLFINHYSSTSEFKHMSPQKIGYRVVTTNSLLRYCLIRIGVALHYNIADHLLAFIWRLKKD